MVTLFIGGDGMDDNIDLGDVKSRDLGNLTSRRLVELGKEVLNESFPNQDMDYGELPSSALTDLGKQALDYSNEKNTL